MTNTIYMHCGLHKTGSTTLQLAFFNQADTLRNHGILYPQSGLMPSWPGHHQIAWQLTGDPRFCPDYGDLNSLFDEIDNFNGKVVLSSEDFESCLDDETCWLPLLQFAKSSKRPLVFVVYVRNQSEYLESLYLQLLKHGFSEDFRSVYDKIMRQSALYFKGSKYLFDYWKIASLLTKIPGISVVFRNYHQLLLNSTLFDFCSVAQIPASIFDIYQGFHANRRYNINASLRLFYKNQIGFDFHRLEQNVLPLWNAQLDATECCGNLHTILTEKFSASNRRLVEHFNIDGRGLLLADNDPAAMKKMYLMDKFFSLKTFPGSENSA